MRGCVQERQTIMLLASEHSRLMPFRDGGERTSRADIRTCVISMTNHSISDSSYSILLLSDSAPPYLRGYVICSLYQGRLPYFDHYPNNIPNNNSNKPSIPQCLRLPRKKRRMARSPLGRAKMEVSRDKSASSGTRSKLEESLSLRKVSSASLLILRGFAGIVIREQQELNDSLDYR